MVAKALRDHRAGGAMIAQQATGRLERGRIRP
jgi:hypothetical protein